jgi:ribosomal protein S18 acetylase RimI-like enzyme
MKVDFELFPTIVDRVEEVLIIARHEGRIVGSAGLWLGKRSASLRRLFVADDCTRRGIGSAILNKAIFEAMRLNKSSFGLAVESRNEAAISLYRKHGFLVGYEHDDGQLSMVKPLPTVCSACGVRHLPGGNTLCSK